LSLLRMSLGLEKLSDHDSQLRDVAKCTASKLAETIARASKVLPIQDVTFPKEPKHAQALPEMYLPMRFGNEMV